MPPMAASLTEPARGAARVALAGGSSRSRRSQRRASTQAVLADPATRAAELVQSDPLADYVRAHGGKRVIRKVRSASVSPHFGRRPPHPPCELAARLARPPASQHGC